MSVNQGRDFPNKDYVHRWIQKMSRSEAKMIAENRSGKVLGSISKNLIC